MKKHLPLFVFIVGYANFALAQHPLVGAIRWDAWTGSSNFVGKQVEQSFSPKQFHFRVPFFGKKVNDTTVTINVTT